MKRLVLLTMLCAFVLGMAATTASAADIKATGSYVFEAVWGDNSFDDDDQDSDFDVYQRLRTKFEFIANENLKGVLYTEVGTSTWGETMRVGDDIDDVVTIKAGYIDFNWPGTQQNIKVGHLNIDLPNAIGDGSIILSDELPTAVISGPITDNVAYLFGWHRLDKSGAQNSTADELDAVSLALPLTFDGISVTPYTLIGYAGDNYDNDLNNVWWAGASFEMTMFDPFVFKADLAYGASDNEAEANETDGWYFAAAAEYKGLDFMTPELFFAYTSGDDEDAATDGGGSMPNIGVGDWALGSFWFGGDWGVGAQSSVDADADYFGFWTLGVSLKDISFFEGLTHTVNVMYIQGTNDDENVGVGTDLTYLSDDDSLWELDLNSQYSIYDELTAYVELGWIAPDWADERNINDDEAWKVSTGLNYEF
ncbi:outer membrane homotrimeric porin [Pseudodesulfovibrio senegalensis]|uniref:Porin n=1 Tax=Pseudodesulfovibrio senegalensis TaxID=1721087 RepID=A0A6N6N9C5_9BACT|nr:outer membrane homotrimeric porin [Pseudodesulfovibrio senegalensis]KAB1443447.1 hypothetical protein F8A88_04125 [Pseudodesulfovibrio senegalensis]